MRWFFLDLHGEHSAGSCWALLHPSFPCDAALSIRVRPEGSKPSRSKWWASLPRTQGEGSVAQVRNSQPCCAQGHIAWGWEEGRFQVWLSG